MARRGRKKAITESPLKPKPSATQEDNPRSSPSRSEDRLRAFNHREVERRIVAIQAVQEAEIENLLSRLRLLRSYLNKEQLETPALKFFQENLCNLSVIRNERYKVFELEWNDRVGGLNGNHVGVDDACASFDNATAPQGIDGLQFSAKSVKSNFLEAANLFIPNFALDDPSENCFMGSRDAFQTPGETSNRLSLGMTPKTLRLPKNGEMLLSVRGSPLGVYREENLEAIHETEDGSNGDAA